MGKTRRVFSTLVAILAVVFLSGCAGGGRAVSTPVKTLQGEEAPNISASEQPAVEEATDTEFCFGPHSGKKFPCEAGDGMSVAGFLRSLEALCSDCSAALRDYAAIQSKQSTTPVTVEQLMFWMQHDSPFWPLLSVKLLYNQVLSDISTTEGETILYQDTLGRLRVLTDRLAAERGNNLAGQGGDFRAEGD